MTTQDKATEAMIESVRPVFGEWLPIESAPKDRDILVYNEMVGSYRSRYTNGVYPCTFWVCDGIWYPKPSLWMELPRPSK